MTARLRPLLICLGRDRRLLETRAWVLATGYEVISMDSCEKLAGLDPPRAVNLAVLCHSLTDEECECSVRVIRSRWPQSLVVSVASPMRACSPPKADGTCGSLDGPAALLGSIAHLLGQEEAARHIRGQA